MRFLAAAILLTLPLALPMSAELRKVEVKVGGLDCNSCADSVDQVVKRIRGVDEATFDAKALLLTVTFKAENKVQLRSILDAVKGIGYTPEETRIVARGALTADRFTLAGVDKAFAVEIPADQKKNTGTDVIVEGTIPASADVLKVKSAKPAAQ